jgi:hypothetical protein
VYLTLCHSKAKKPIDLLEAGVEIAGKSKLAPETKQRVLVMMLMVSNKIIDKDALRKVWEDIRMTKLVAFEVAEEYGIEKGIRALVEVLIEYGCDLDAIQIKIVQKYNLSEQDAKKYVEMYLPVTT